MFDKYSPRWIKLVAKTIVPALLLVLIANQALAASSCKKVKGKFTLQAFSGPACTSPVSFCANGSFSGDLAGTSVFIGTSLIQTADTPATGVVFATGDTIITTNDGTLITKDAISLATTGKGEFGEVDTIVGGTRQWLGATGKFTATGTFANGVGEGVYSGEVCTP